jgi:outer membrane protein assembly factor BamB
MSFRLIRSRASRVPRPLSLNVLAAAAALFVLSGSSRAQAALDWTATQTDNSGDEFAQVVAAAADGSVYVAAQVPAAQIHSDPNTDVRITKFTSGGSLEWSSEWDGYGYADAPTAMLAAPDGGVFVATSDRRVNQFGVINRDAVVRKFASDGALLWLAKVQGFGGNGLQFNQLALLSNGALVGVGSKSQTTLIARISASGTLEWQHSVGGALGGSVLRDCEVLEGDEIVACGSKGTQFNGAMALFKYAPDGTPLWTTLVDADVEQRSHGAALALTPSGRAVVAGYRYLGLADDMALAQFDLATGAVEWRLYHDAGDPTDELRDVAVTPDGVIWGAGRRRVDPSSEMDTFVLRVDGQGDVLSTATWPGGAALFDQPQSIHVGSAGQTWLTVMSGLANRDIVLLQYDSAGELSSEDVFDLGGDDIGFVAALAPNERLIVAGSTNAGGDYDFLAARFDLSDAPSGYCTAKVNSLGCAPRLTFTGRSSASAASGFELVCDNVRNQKAGMLLYSLHGADAAPFQGGYLCVGAPRRRTPVTASNGSAGGDDCSGVLALDLNAFASGQLGGAPAPELTVAGAEVHCQQWSRDPGATGASGLSAGLRFVVGP